MRLNCSPSASSSSPVLIVDAMVERARADPRRRPPSAPESERPIGARETAQPEGDRKSAQRESTERAIVGERLVGLLLRQLDEYQPVRGSPSHARPARAPFELRATASALSRGSARAERTCCKCEKSVFRKTRLISGWAMSRPSRIDDVSAAGSADMD